LSRALYGLRGYRIISWGYLHAFCSEQWTVRLANWVFTQIFREFSNWTVSYPSSIA
jgi:hypothetical protein